MHQKKNYISKILTQSLPILLIVIIGISSCNNEVESNITDFVANKRFAFALVSSQQECDHSLSFGVNCAQSVDFGDNMNATVVVTDILNGGIYEISGRTITITIQIQGDAENPMVFEANSDFTELTRTSNGSNDIWKLQTPGVNPWDL